MSDPSQTSETASETAIETAASHADRPTVFHPGLFAGKTVLVSGGTGGIGQATAWLYARLGARTIVTGRKEEALAAFVAATRQAGYDTHAYPLNVRDRDGVVAVFDRIDTDLGGIDVLINSAGGQFPQPAIDFSEKGWRAVIDTNLNGTWFMMQEAAKRWRDASRPGSIVNLVVVTTHGLYGVAHTLAARSGVVTLSNQMAVEWAQHRIRVNCIAPGAIETEGWRVYSEEARSTYARSNPMMRTGTPWDIAESCIFLTSPAAGFISGTVLTVDGGGQHWGETWTTGKPDYFRD